MRKILPIICFIALFANASHAQGPVINGSFAPGIGETFTYRTIDTTGIDETVAGPGGGNVTWNLSQYFITLTQFLYNYVDPTTTAYTAQFPTANLASTNSVGLIEYYNASSTDYVYLGGRFNSDYTNYGAGVSWFDYNFDYLDSITETVSGTFASGSVSGTVTTVADGWGTLTLSSPVGSNSNVLRVKRTALLDYNYGPGVDDYVTQTTYIWYRAACKEALLIMNFRSSTFYPYEKSVYATGGCIINSANEIPQTNSFSTYPNPSSTHFTVNFDNIQQKNQLDIVDITGKVVKTFANVINNQSIEIDDLASGIYTLQMNNNGELLRSKIVKK